MHATTAGRLSLGNETTPHPPGHTAFRRSRVGIGLAILATVVYVALVLARLNRPLMYDDANFALAARAVADTGVPFGNQGWMSDRGDFTHREQWALWHPPLYIYTIGVATRLLGWTPWALRLIGVLGGLAVAYLTWLLARDLTRGPPATKDVAAGIALSLAMLCPLVVQSTLIVDIDFPLLLPLSLLLLWLYGRLEASRRAWLWLSPLFAVLLWAKMTNPLTLLAVIGTWQILRGRIARGVAHVVAIAGGGALLAGIAWVGVGSWLQFPLDMPFGVNLVEAQDSSEVARRAYLSAGAFIEGLQPTVIWLGPGLVALGLLGIGIRLGALARGWRMRRVDLLIGAALLLVLLYVNKSAGWFPKYQVPLAPLLACIAVPVIAHLRCSRPRLVAATLAGSTVAASVVTLVLVRDQWAIERTWATPPSAAAWLLGVVVVAALVGVALRAPAATAVAALVGLALGWSIAVNATQVLASYSTTYWYATNGMPETTSWIDANLSPDQTYVASKEVALASHAQRYVDQDNIVYLLSIGRPLESTWAGEPLEALVIWERDPYIADLFARRVPGSGFAEAGHFGDYVVYVPRSS
jgi:4-amino-4-deoxy-L-arabinose transferase-like glycosyltransferase